MIGDEIMMASMARVAMQKVICNHFLVPVYRALFNELIIYRTS